MIREAAQKLSDIVSSNKGKTLPENEYNPLQRLKIAKTIYPKGVKQMSLNGKHEWYGIQIDKPLNR